MHGYTLMPAPRQPVHMTAQHWTALDSSVLHSTT
eukprot:CAMPEP_0177656204 /NCGR_PEP_ID=MMETSP0447-20121125/15420_1 /TAXON_ID=0 /ORGANISM="Stygamoeba regulata, Strain BSH-02190019" /LENGTH=33 /DNA_ID= /DNA_START= /DNA_END= /DNA_ORIENTATION=